MVAVVLGVPRAAGCLLCYVAVVLGCLLSLAASVVSGADGLPLVSPASPCAAAGPLFLRSRPSVAEQSATPEALITSPRIVLAACVLRQQVPIAP